MTKRSHNNDREYVDLLQDAHRELHAFILAMLQNRADADDVYQQTALVLWRKFSEYQPGTSFIAWAIRVAQFEIMNYVKARRRRKVFFNDGILEAVAANYQIESSEAQAARLEALAKCLDRLSPRDRTMLMQCYSVGSDYREIAAAAGKSLTAVYKAISRIRQALHYCIQKSLAAEGD